MLTNSILVSISMPAYNAAPYIRQAIKSAQSQTIEDIEIIVCDDGSTDDTYTIVEEMARDDPRIRLLRNTENRGLSYTRNRTFREARGKWIALLDADDFFAPDRLEKLLRIAETTDADLVGDNLRPVDTEGNDLGKDWLSYAPLRKHAKKDNAWKLDVSDFILSVVKRTDRCYGYMQPLIRTAFLTSNDVYIDEALKNIEDFPFFVSCYIHGASYYVLDEALYNYRITPSSQTRENKGRAIDKAREVHADIMQGNQNMIRLAERKGRTDIAQLLRKRQRRHEKVNTYHEIVVRVRNGNLPGAAKHLFRNVTAWPFILRYFSDRMKTRLERNHRK